MDGALANGPLAGAAWLIAAAALAAAAGFGVMLRSQAARLRDAEASRDEAELGAEALRARMASQEQGKKKQGDDRVELRRKLEKARKRAAAAREDEQRAAARIAELEAQVARRSADLEAVRVEAAAEAPPAPEPPALADPAELEAARKERDRLAKQGEELRTRALGAEAAVDELRAELEKLRHKAKTQDRLYLAMRGELDAKKDRLRAQAEQLERLQALRVVMGAADGEGTEPPEGTALPPEGTALATAGGDLVATSSADQPEPDSSA